MSIKVETADALKMFREYSVKAKTTVEQTLVKSGLLVSATSKRLFRPRNVASEYNAPPRVDTGRLRASIASRLIRENTVAFVEIGTNVEYAADLEFGSSKNMPHPFLSPALEEHRAEIMANLAEDFKNA